MSQDEQCKPHLLRRWSPNSFSSKCSPEVTPESFPVLMGQIPSQVAGQHPQHPGELCPILTAPQHHPSFQLKVLFELSISTIQQYHSALHTKGKTWFLFNLSSSLSTNLWLTQASQREIFFQHGQEKLEKCPRVEWSRLWIRLELFRNICENWHSSMEPRELPRHKAEASEYPAHFLKCS